MSIAAKKVTTMLIHRGKTHSVSHLILVAIVNNPTNKSTKTKQIIMIILKKKALIPKSLTYKNIIINTMNVHCTIF